MDPNLENVSNEIIEASTPEPVSVESKPHKPKGLIFTTVFFALLAVAGIAGAIYFFIDSNNKAATNADLRSKLDLIKMETGAELVEKQENGTTVTEVELPESDESEVRTLVKEIYQDLAVKIPTAPFKMVFEDGSIIKIPDSNIYSSSNVAYGITSATSVHDKTINDIVSQNAHIYVEAFLSSNGFNEDSFNLLLIGKLLYNPNTQIYCLVSENALPFSVSCSKENWITNETKTLAEKLASIANSPYVAVDPSHIVDSQVSPYQTITANGGGAALLFYRTSKDADWQFFKASQGLLNCNEYDTEDLKNAYAGQMCFNESTGETITVQP